MRGRHGRGYRERHSEDPLRMAWGSAAVFGLALRFLSVPAIRHATLWGAYALLAMDGFPRANLTRPHLWRSSLPMRMHCTALTASSPASAFRP